VADVAAQGVPEAPVRSRRGQPLPIPSKSSARESTFVVRPPYLGVGANERSRMDGEQSIAVLERLLADKGEDLLRTAILLTGSRF
jgi:hypothetical protein